MGNTLDFADWHDGLRNDECDRVPPYRTICDLRSPSMYINEIERFLNWIGLLAKFEYKVTPDVVAVYAIATRQETLVPGWFQCAGICEEYRSIRGLQDNAPYKQSYGYGINQVPNDIPREMFTMAEHYMLDRVADYVNTVYEAIGNASLYRTAIGTPFPKTLCVALRSFASLPREVPSVEKLIDNVKSLYATVMPQVSAAVDRTFGCSCCSRGSTKVPPTIRLNKEEEVAASGDPKLYGNAVEKADAAVTRGCNVLWDHIGKLAEILKSSGTDYNLTDRMMIKEAFCLACEIAVWIIHHRETPVRMSYYPRPKMAYDEVNLLIAKEFVNRHGSTAQNVQSTSDCKVGCCGDYVRYISNMLGMLSPNAALCLGNGIRVLIRPGCITWEMDRFADRLLKQSRDCCPEVVAFFRSEVSEAVRALDMAQRYAAEQDKRAIETSKKEGV